MKKRIGLTFAVILGALYALGNVFSLTLNFPNINLSSFEERFSSIHFMTPGNNFVGSIFRLPTKSISGTYVSVQGTPHSKTCTKQLRGLYFNSQRGKRLRPLDNDSLDLLRQQNGSYNDLSLSGGLFTTCDTSGENYGIFGAITYSRGNITTHIIAGTRLDYNHNKMIAAMSNSFQYFDNKVPIGYIYDSNGGIGFVGGSLSGHENLIEYLSGGGSINSGFTYSGTTIVANNNGWETTIESGNTAMETMRNLIIKGSVGLSRSMDEKERISFLGNVDEQTVIYNGSDINSSTVINFAKQKAQSLCQGQEINIPLIDSDTIACFDHDIKIDLEDESSYTNKTIIVKDGNVLLANNGGMGPNSPSLDLFIDKGMLYLPEPITEVHFNEQGFPESSGINAGLYLKGNFIINGLVVGNNLNPFTHKLHVQGKIIMLNTPTTPTAGRIAQVNDLLGPGYENFINLQNVFTWMCGLGGTGTDGSSCLGTNIISTIPLVILNGNYSSNLLQ